MGIALKDLKVGSYYKGYHQPAPQGMKCFYYVLQSSYTQGQSGPMLLEISYILRRQKVPATTWSPRFVHAGPPDEASLLKEEVSAADLQAEQLPLAPPIPYQRPVPTPKPVIRLPMPGLSPAELAAIAKAERNKGKITIPENARSTRCVKCHGVNRVVELFQFSSYFCPTCEPE